MKNLQARSKVSLLPPIHQSALFRTCTSEGGTIFEMNQPSYCEKASDADPAWNEVSGVEKTGRRGPVGKKDSEAPAPPPSLHGLLQVAAPRKRNRQWEKHQQSRKAVYRGVDPKLALKVKAIADDLLMPTGEVACAVLEYALQSYGRGDFDLHPQPDPERMRMTLFPRSDSSRKKPLKALWRVVTTWRGFSPELKQELAALASEDGLHVPIGELITALLRFGLKAYETGLLRLEPKPKSTAFRLTHKDKG